MIYFVLSAFLLTSPNITYQGILGEYLPYNAYQFVDLIEDGDFYYARNDFFQAESIYQQAYNLALSRKNYKLLTVALISLGTALGKQGYNQSALEKFKAALINKGSIYNLKLLSVLYYNLGVAYQHLSQFDSAIINYNNTIKLDSGYIDAYKNRGLTFYNKSEFANAIENYNLALELKPDYADVMVLMADAYLIKDDSVSAKHWYEQALQNKTQLQDCSETVVQKKITELSKYIRE